MCGARATPTISVKLNLGTQTAPTVSVKLDRCGGYRIREDGYRAAESPDVWRMRHSSVSVKLDRGSAMTTVSVKMGQADPATRCVAHAPLFRIREVGSGECHGYRIREDGSGESRYSRCVAHAPLLPYP
ncbi:hypothetical protein D3C87_352000 [compost metagenome]